MPIKRRLAKGITHRITPEAIAAFGAGDWMALHRALGLAPWQVSPLDTDTPLPPAWASQCSATVWAGAWQTARDLRQALTEARDDA
jgi:hypothetical protein